MKKNKGFLIQLFTAFGLCFSLLGGVTNIAQAATCTWNGSVNADWTVSGNWTDCGGSVPDTDDAVVIPDTTLNPIIPVASGVSVSSISIESGGHLTVMGGSAVSAALWNNSGTLVSAATAPVFLLGTGIFNNYGIIIKTGSDDLIMYPALNNSGTFDIQEGGVVLDRGGVHTGNFYGTAGTTLYLGLESTSQTHTFESGSDIRVPRLFIRGGTTNIKGTYWPPAVGSFLFTAPIEQCTLVFTSSANVVNMAETTIVSNWGKIILESGLANPVFPKLTLSNGGEINNLDEITISNQFSWLGGKISGAGTTTILPGVSFTMQTSAHQLDGQTLVNAAAASWNGGGIDLINAAIFQNDNTFNANATTTMSGGTNGSFVNNGNFYKNTAGTTTTMDIAFTNNSIVRVNGGTLVFPAGLIFGTDTVINLGGGTLNPGDTLNLEAGDSLTGSGTLVANLDNSGMVSPGQSAGKIIVDGDYRQDSTGTLEIELGGTSPGTGYDQLAVVGTATLAGTLDVKLISGFVLSAGQSFTVLTYHSHNLVFDTINLPDLTNDITWKVEYLGDRVSLSLGQVPQIMSGNQATFAVGSSGSFTITTTGVPSPDIAQSGDLPGGITFTDNGDGTATLSGTPFSGTAGEYALVLKADNGFSDVIQNFTLTVVNNTSFVYLPLITH